VAVSKRVFWLKMLAVGHGEHDTILARRLLDSSLD